MNKTAALVLFGAVILAAKFLAHPNLREGYFGVGPPQTVIAQRVAATPSGQFFDVPGNFQATLSPRFSNVNYGSYIRYNMPNTQNLAVDPQNPLTLSNMVYDTNNGAVQLKEQYCGGPPNAANYQSMNPSSNASNGMIAPQMQYNTASDMLPVQAMGTVVNALGEADAQPIIYDRYIFANQKSRLAGAGDMIRGDLPIVPEPTGWFRPSGQYTDLTSGALMAIGGADNTTSKELQALRSAAAGNAVNTGGGISYSISQSPYSSMASADINVTAFP